MTEQEIYDSYKRRSTTGASAKRNPNRKIRMTYKNYKNTLMAVSIATAITVSGLIAGGSHLVDKMQDSMTIGQLHTDFRMEYIVPETHRTQDNQHYFYDYDDIARHLEEYGDFDIGVYLLVTDIGEYQTDRVMHYTNYDTVASFLERSGYKDLDDFKKTMEKKISIKHEMETDKEELKQMMEEHPVENQNEDIYGGGSK